MRYLISIRKLREALHKPDSSKSTSSIWLVDDESLSLEDLLGLLLLGDILLMLEPQSLSEAKELLQNQPLKQAVDIKLASQQHPPLICGSMKLKEK